ncbi:hypothetical protein SAMN02745857_02756 [Andreprevotia lacus DSM 23236]|jgi:hypothetical protein|uniref:Uncharacterized protein n=1 Tax=Andreprevotia lacus DSM 23236 TaxID=1121001 RepID=A0A1W1XTC8_9NEIS|nr:hypothetical protein [Andreprevotia lacus]SMC27219.1 hypothetical protein SAMN02745857_02756 [Andreprevotia lacus DSM 23236]
MKWQPISFALRGGYNAADPAAAVQPGEVLFAENFEAVREGGYRRIDGYTCYDGSASPVEVPGSGPLRGLMYLGGTLFAVRDNAAATAAVLYRAGSSGWQPVALSPAMGFNNGFTNKITQGATITGGTSGATALVLRVLVNNGDWSGTPSRAAGSVVLGNITGNWQVGETIKIGGNVCANVASLPAAPVLLPGGSYRSANYNFGGAAGNVRIYGVDGVNPAFEFDGTVFAQIRTGMPSDKPFLVAAHRNYLFLAYAGGSVQYSGLGDPLTFMAKVGAGELALGDEATNLVSYRGEVMVMTCRDRVLLLYGSSQQDFQVKIASQAAGASLDSAREVSGELYYMSGDGLTTLQATQAYGDFASAVLSRKVQPLLDVSQAQFAFVSRDKSQLRLVMADRVIWTFTVMTDGSVDAMRTRYPSRVVCAGSWRDSGGKEVLFAGLDNGRVVRIDSGTSFDGASITAILRLAFAVPNRGLRCRLHRLALQMLRGNPTDFMLRVDYDYGRGTPSDHALSALGAGGLYDQAAFDSARYDGGMYAEVAANLSGVAESFDLMLVQQSAASPAWGVAAATVYVTPRGSVR